MFLYSPAHRVFNLRIYTYTCICVRMHTRTSSELHAICPFHATFLTALSHSLMCYCCCSYLFCSILFHATCPMTRSLRLTHASCWIRRRACPCTRTTCSSTSKLSFRSRLPTEGMYTCIRSADESYMTATQHASNNALNLYAALLSSTNAFNLYALLAVQ